MVIAVNKTPFRKRYTDQIQASADHIWYFLFSDQELSQHIDSLADKDREKYTTEIFPLNKYGERIHRKIVDLNEFRKNNHRIIVNGSFISAYEFFVSYGDDVENFRGIVSPSEYDNIKDDVPEDQLYNKLIEWGADSICQNYTKTMTYFRFRRNHAAHVRISRSAGFDRFIARESEKLNVFWNNKTKNPFSLDFCEADIMSSDISEGLSAFYFVRICIEEIDKLLAATISLNEVIEHEIKEMLVKNPNSKGNIDVISRKLRTILVTRYGEKIDAENVAVHVRAIY